MTTIACDGKSLAGDTRISDDDCYTQATKVFRLKNGVVGVAGDYAHAHAFVAWLRCWERGTSQLPSPILKDYGALYLSKTGAIYEFDDNPIPYKIEAKAYAIGSGAQAALAAMMCGKTAAQAVRIAAKIDSGTGGKVTCFKIKD